MRTLVVLGTILTLVSVLAIWVDRLALDTDTWVSTSDELLQDDEIRAVLAATLGSQPGASAFDAQPPPPPDAPPADGP